jgi:hypothetical protein
MEKGRADDSRPAFERALIPPAEPARHQQPLRLDFEPLFFDLDFEPLHFDLDFERLPPPHEGGVGLQLERPEPPAP